MDCKYKKPTIEIIEMACQELLQSSSQYDVHVFEDEEYPVDNAW